MLLLLFLRPDAPPHTTSLPAPCNPLPAPLLRSSVPLLHSSVPLQPPGCRTASFHTMPPPAPTPLCPEQTLPEKEARTIVAQILAGLVYLNTKPRSVIHYDLKPANILFDRNGECKLTVSGAEKLIET